MAAITSVTESWNGHKFSEVESHVKGSYTTVGGADMTHATETITWGTLTGTSYTPLWQIRSPYIGSDYGCAYLCGYASDIPGCGGTAVSMQIDGYFYQKGGAYRVCDTSDLAGYSKTSHTHSNYSLTSHTHSNYSLTSHTHSYLPLTGGTIQNGSDSYPFNINSTASNTWMYFRCSGTNKTSIGYWNNMAFVASEVASGYPRIGVTDAGNPEFWTEAGTYKYAIHTSRDGAKFGGSLEVFSDGNSWSEGIRIHPASNEWCGIIFCEKSNSGSTNTSSKTWSIHNNEGNFVIAKSGSSESTASSCIANTDGSTWRFKTNITATGGITALSDIREKTIVKDIDISTEQIASASSVLFKWNDKRDDELHAGSIAQDWQKILPQAVLEGVDEKKTLSLNYGVAALVSSITTARDVVSIKEKIKSLEDEIVKLKEKL